MNVQLMGYHLTSECGKQIQLHHWSLPSAKSTRTESTGYCWCKHIILESVFTIGKYCFSAVEKCNAGADPWMVHTILLFYNHYIVASVVAIIKIDIMVFSNNSYSGTVSTSHCHRRTIDTQSSNTMIFAKPQW